MTAQEFLSRIKERDLKALDQSVALLWWAGREDHSRGLSTRSICEEIEFFGFPKQNMSRLEQALNKDRRASKNGKSGWRLHPRARRELDQEYSFALAPKPPAATDSVLPRALFHGTRGYIERVVDQINKSYDAQLYDCSSVMARRLMETLIIEVYEHAGRASSIKGGDGHFMMLNGLISFLESDGTIDLGRNAAKGFKDFKQLGDQSAHNRRFNANANDIDRVRDGLRIAAEELLHLAGLKV